MMTPGTELSTANQRTINTQTYAHANLVCECFKPETMKHVDIQHHKNAQSIKRSISSHITTKLERTLQSKRSKQQERHN